MPKQAKQKTGFTLIEIIVVLAIFSIILTLVISPFHEFRQNKLLIDSAEIIVSTLRTARANTLSAEADNQYGVLFESKQLIIFPGSEYSPEVMENQIIHLPQGVLIKQIDLNNGGQEVFFNRLIGTPSTIGVITLGFEGEIDKSQLIKISANGIIEVIRNE